MPTRQKLTASVFESEQESGLSKLNERRKKGPGGPFSRFEGFVSRPVHRFPAAVRQPLEASKAGGPFI